MSLKVVRVHSIANDVKEGQAIFKVVETVDNDALNYVVSTIKTATGIAAVTFDVRVAFNAEKKYARASKAYLQNLGLPAAFIALVEDSSGNIADPSGAGAVTIPKASLDATTADSTITTDVTIQSITGVTTGGGTITPPPPAKLPVDPTVKPPVEEPHVETAAEKKARLAAEADDKKGLSTNAKWGIGAAIVAVIGAVVAFVWHPWKD